MHLMRFNARYLALAVLLAICMQMAVCMTADHCVSDMRASSSVPGGADCSCHDCSCCSLHAGFPPETHIYSASLIEILEQASAPRIKEKSGPSFERPPRS